jgi:hypothetical protein
VVHDQQVAEPAHPVGVDHLALRDRPHRPPFRGADEHAFRLHPRRSSWSAETLREFPSYRQGQLAAKRGERPLQGTKLAAADRGDDLREARFIGPQHADFLAVLADIGGKGLQHPLALAALAEQFVTVGAARLLDRAQTLGAAPGIGRQALELRNGGALLGEQARRGARDLPEVVQTPADVRGVASGKRDAQGVRGSGGGRRDQDALDRRFPFRNLTNQQIALLADASGLGAHLARLGGEARQRPVGVGDRALGVAQRVARLALRAFLLLQVAVERLDAAAQRFQVFFLGRGHGRAGSESQQKKRDALQAFTFPCAATEATRRATSSGSPR